MSLYKYLVPQRLDILRHLRIRFTQPTALNDPFELRPVVRGLKDIASTTQLLSEQFDRADLPEEFQRFAQQLNLAVPELKDGLRASVVAGAVGIFSQFSQSLVELVFESLGTKLGILSLSETPSSPVMWAHYADNHSGFLIVFDEQHPWFCAKMGYEDEFRHLRKVSYVDAASLGIWQTCRGKIFFTAS